MSGIKIIDLENNMFQDERGWVANPLDILELPNISFYHFHIVSMKPGSTRGNHYHMGAKEWLFVCEGEALMSWREKNGKTVNHKKISPSKPVLFEINPNIVHSITNTSNNDIFLISFSDSRQRETYKCSL